MLRTLTDDDGDKVMAVETATLIVFAVESCGQWMLNFASKSDVSIIGDKLVSNDCWMDTMTGRGFFATVRELRPAINEVLAAIGDNWKMVADERRARAYSRYFGPERFYQSTKD